MLKLVRAMVVSKHSPFEAILQIQLDSGGDNEWHKKKITSFQ